MEISASKNKSSFPANGLFGRRAPLATVWMQPNDSVHHETIRLVSLSLRLRKRMAAVIATRQGSTRGNCRGACAKHLPLNSAFDTNAATTSAIHDVQRAFLHI